MTDRLMELLAIPTAPFRESLVATWLEKWLAEEMVPFFRDRAGNLVAGVKSEKAYRTLLGKKQKEPLRLAIAHMDHPGFHGVKWLSATELGVQWFGGSPTELCDGAKVWMASVKNPDPIFGVFQDVKLAPHGKSIQSATVQLQEKDATPLSNVSATDLFGGFSFRAPAWVDQETIYTKAADDLVGVYCIVQALVFQKKKNKKKELLLIGLISRAEEVGFIGTLAHLKTFYSKPNKRKVVAVSLETSRQLPNAEIGKGPIVRLGDRSGPFSPGPTQLLSEAAKKILPDAHQRRIMDGGSCEATAAITFGLDAIALSVPLGNYHNQSFEGGPDSRGQNGPAPEFVHQKDIAGMLTLLLELSKPGHRWDDPFLKKKKELLSVKEHFQRLHM